MIPYARQDVSEADIRAVIDVLRSDLLTQGPVVPAFEEAVAKQCDARHAVAMSSATAALHVACMALEVGPGDLVWTTPITFVATANCALYCGADIDFVDIDPATNNLCINRLAEKLMAAKIAGRLPKAVIAVHFAGQPCDMAGIEALSGEYGFYVIEDASHAIGATYRGEPIGNSRYSDITIFSFHPVKMITTGEGGMALTNDGALARRMERLRTHGVTRDANEMTCTPDGPWYYQQLDLGFNYRMTDIQAALGLSQLQRLDEYVTARHAIADRYDKQLSNLPVQIPLRQADRRSAIHLYVIRLLRDKIAKSRRAVFEELRAAGIGVNVHYIPVHLQPYYRRYGFKVGDYPKAEEYYSEALSLPMYPTLTLSQQEYVTGTLNQVLRN